MEVSGPSFSNMGPSGAYRLFSLSSTRSEAVSEPCGRNCGESVLDFLRKGASLAFLSAR